MIVMACDPWCDDKSAIFRESYPFGLAIPIDSLNSANFRRDLHIVHRNNPKHRIADYTNYNCYITRLISFLPIYENGMILIVCLAKRASFLFFPPNLTFSTNFIFPPAHRLKIDPLYCMSRGFIKIRGRLEENNFHEKKYAHTFVPDRDSKVQSLSSTGLCDRYAWFFFSDISKESSWGGNRERGKPFNSIRDYNQWQYCHNSNWSVGKDYSSKGRCSRFIKSMLWWT